MTETVTETVTGGWRLATGDWRLATVRATGGGTGHRQAGGRTGEVVATRSAVNR